MHPDSRFFVYESISPRLRRILIGLGFVTILGIGIWFAPYPLSLYHQARGGQLMETVFSKSAILADSTACEQVPLVNETARIQLTQAVKQFQRAIDYNSKDAHSYLLLGQAYCLLGEPHKAIDAYTGFTDLRPDNPLGDLEAGFAYEAIGDWSSAVRKWKTAGITAQDFLENGEELRREESYEEALEWYARASQLSPNWAEPWYRMGLVYKEQENWEEAISADLQAAKLLPGNRDIWYELGQAYSSRQEWDLALHAYEQGLRASSGEAGLSNFYFRIGVIRQYSLSPRDFEGAWESYNQALKLDDYPIEYWMKADTYYQRGVILGRSGHWTDALREYQKALELNPRHYWAHLLSASSLWKLGREEEAKEMARATISLKPDKKDGYMLLGDLFGAERNISQASDMYKKVLEIDPQDQAARSALEGLGGTFP